ncbi:hypothetical protein SCLCIDRAFT_1212374 [Scleroderma citrinum Foug A]|uniref:Uncharacterized protein n=1 Tax=Scleroderma citrinum Foug A TaxID=1036808 RepID=A0A0C3AJW9_9AGAM|nr:hypothetical protein SCLCIDRAFT_1212374 [Scleroderma citrinum Foug A]
MLPHQGLVSDAEPFPAAIPKIIGKFSRVIPKAISKAKFERKLHQDHACAGEGVWQVPLVSPCSRINPWSGHSASSLPQACELSATENAVSTHTRW